jgi:hypothetical protein
MCGDAVLADEGSGCKAGWGCELNNLRERVQRLIDGAKSNERRWMANEELKAIADQTHPWTVEALQAEARRWLADDPKERNDG